MKTSVRIRTAIENKAPDVDIEKRILRNVVVMTDKLASDGAIVLMSGLDTKDRFESNPIVQAKHARAGDMSPQADVIGRAIDLTRGEHELVSEVQFADTDLGREYAYLYGVNPEKEVFMRAWSGGFRVLTSDLLEVDAVKDQYAAQWDQAQFDQFPSWMDRVEIVRASSLTEFSAVGRGADKAALTRALRDGVRAAGDVIANQDFENLQAMLQRAVMASAAPAWRMDLERINRRLLALEGKGTSAALQGDTDELRAEIEKLTAMIRH